MEASEMLKTLVDEVRKLAETKTIVGEPMEFAGNTVIPVTRLMVGFAGGSGSGEGGDEAKKQQGSGSGGGGGGGVRVEPAAFIVIKGGELSVLAAPGKRGAMAELFEHVPDLIDKIVESQKGQGEAKRDAS